MSHNEKVHFFLAVYEEDEGESIQSCEQTNNLGIIVNSAFIPSANVLIQTNKARGMLYLVERLHTYLTKVFVPIFCSLVKPHLEYVIKANCIPRKRHPQLRKKPNDSRKVGERS